MPKPVQYRSGSIIYFKGDPADKIYILQNGKVSLVSQDIETGEDIKDSVQPGEFFGVKSALGRYSREENAVALSDTALMAFTVPEFEAVAMANSRIIMKMLKVFSNQMRRVHKQVSNLMEKTEEEPPADGLYNVGDFYLKNKRFSHAKYVFSRYLTYYPSGKYAVQASQNFEIAERAALQLGGGKGPIPSPSVKSPTQAQSSPAPSAHSPSAPSPAAPSKAPSADVSSKSYYDGVSLVSQGKYQEAFIRFKSIVDANTDLEYVNKSSFEIGRCMFLLNKFEESIRYYTGLLTKNPNHPDLSDIMFLMGQSNEKLGRKDQAAAFYKKILSLGINDNDGTIAKVKRALAALGA